MSNLLKANYTKNAGSMVIDSNHLVAEKLEAIKKTLLKEGSKDLEQIHDGFTSGIRAEVIEELPNPEEELNQLKEEAQIEIEQLKYRLYLAEMENTLLKKLNEIEGGSASPK